MKEEDSFPFKVGEIIESKYNTDGYRGSWFKSEIVKISSRNGGEVWCALKYPDYPDEKLTWTKAYQFTPFLDKDSKQKIKELMLRPAFPPVVQRCNYNQSLYLGSTVAVVDDEWKVGDLVDWWKDECFWECQIIEILDKDNVKVELPKRPIGEGNGSPYVAASRDLRPSLKWCPQYGWRVPSKAAFSATQYLNRQDRALYFSMLSTVVNRFNGQSEFWTTFQVKPYERSCVLLLNVQAEPCYAVKIDPDTVMEPDVAVTEHDEEEARLSHLGKSRSDDGILDSWKSKYPKTKKLKRCPEASFASSCVGSCRGDCTSCSGEAVLKQIELIVDSQMDCAGVDSRAWVGEDAKPTQRSFDTQKKLMLSRKIVRNAKRSFWARRFSPLTSCITAVQQELDHGQVDDKAQFQPVDSHFEKALVVHNVPFSVATPPLFSECRNRSTGGKSSCDRLGPLSGSPGLDSAENNVKVGDFTDVVMEVVDREICNKEQNTCSLQSNVKLDELHGTSSQEECKIAKNSEISLKYLEVPMAYTTYVWEGGQRESLGLLQKEKLQHQACILALPAFNHLPALERRRIQGRKRISSLKKLVNINESHTQNINKSPAYWKHQRIDTACAFQSGKKSVHCASASRLSDKSLLSSCFLEDTNLQSSYQKAFDPPFAAGRPEKSGQNQNVEPASHATVVGEDANTEEIIAMLLALQEMGEKLNFMKDCLQLGMRKLFQKREKAIWNVTTTIL